MRYERRKPFKKEFKNHYIECRFKSNGNTFNNEYVIKYTGNHVPRKSKIRSELLDKDRVWWTNDNEISRDNQKQKLYDAERAALNNHKKKFKNHLEAARFLAKVISNKWFIDNFMIREVIMLHDHRNHISARGGGIHGITRIGKIKIPDWACSDWVVLHELAHCCQEHPPAHGRNFCYIFLLLVEKFMSKQAASDLKEEYNKRNVKFWIYGTSEPHIQKYIANGNCPF